MPAILRPPAAAFSRAAACALALALASCAGSWERAVEETRAGFIRKTGRELRDCLGVPTDFDREGEVERLTYRFPYTRARVSMPPVTTSRGMPGRESMGFPPDPESEGFCQLEFELDASGVTKVTALGRDDRGLGANGACMLRAQPCVDGDYRLE